MLLKISRIKNLGVFDDYSWNAQLPSFERYNVIYGDNGSGKTTLSRLLDSLKEGRHDDYPELEFKIESESGDISHSAPATRNIRVFNADYVRQNIGDFSENLKPILVIGEENKAVAAQIVAEQNDLRSRREVIQTKKNHVEELETSRGRLFTDIARTIGEATSGNVKRTYRKPDAEREYRKIVDPNALSEDLLEAHRTTVRQQVMEAIPVPPPITIELGDKQSLLSDACNKILLNASAVCEKSATAEAITRLKQNPEISLWVETGYALHKKNESRDCEFCGQSIPKQRWSDLENHFSTADQALKDEIEEWIGHTSRLQEVVKSISSPTRLAFYSDLRDELDRADEKLETARSAILQQLNEIRETLQRKLLARNESLTLAGSLDPEHLDQAINAIAAIVAKHNAKTSSFDEALKAAQSAVTHHYLSGIKDVVDDYDRQIEETNELIIKLTDASPDTGTLSLVDLEKSISEKKSQLSSAHKAALELTQRLHTFLGREDLTFESEETGYRLLRNGKAARKLSEGERTAIAFIYFIVQLRDQDFSLSEGIVVIDDPISSLDAGSVYQAFAFLKNAVIDAKQVFLLTHNFSFLRLVLNWFEHIRRKQKTLGKTGFYMLVCKTDATSRRSTICPLDEMLVKYPTEYHFLFKTLAQFEGDGTIAACYHIPNIARKVLETFTDFYVPGSESVHAKLMALEFDENKKAAILKFANDSSHRTGQGFEPGLVQESQKNTAHLMEMIKSVAPEHHKGMIDSIS